MQLNARVTATSGTGAEPRYRPISQYGIIGDCRTAALIGPDGSVDWCCMPHFDSPAVFCRLLDADRGGYFRITPTEPTRSSMAYLPETNILETTFQGSEGRLRVVDFMPIRKRQQRRKLTLAEHLHAIVSRMPRGLDAGLERELGNDVAAAHRINRIATCLEGRLTVALELKATFDYARQRPVIERFTFNDDTVGAILTAGGRYLVLLVRRLRTLVSYADAPTVTLGGDDETVSLRMTLLAGQGFVSVVNYARTVEEARRVLAELIGHNFYTDLDETRTYWRDWAASCEYNGTYQYAVLRSALLLKLCTFEPTGAIVAAPTTSLPETIGGVRNWDYRYTWLRDSSLTLAALERLGYSDEARDYFHFLHDLQIKNGDDIRLMYGIRGESDGLLLERTLDHLEGYMGSRPVRIGNGAATQCQLDIYGELLDAAYSYLRHAGFRRGSGNVTAMRDLRELSALVAEYVLAHWQDKDQGIWEVRGEPRAFVYSRAMCWVAMDRAVKMATHHGHDQQVRRWTACRDAIHADVVAHGFDEQLRSFVQAYGTTVLDAANLRLPLVDFLPWDDTRIAGTVEATKQLLSGPRGVVYRYRTAPGHASAPDGSAPQADPRLALPESRPTDDGLPGKEGAFLACAFWLIDNLCYLGRVEEARERFEQILGLAGPLGLFAEEVDPDTGEQLGNYPQALTHIGLINSAVTLQRAQEGTLVAHPDTTAAD